MHSYFARLIVRARGMAVLAVAFLASCGGGGGGGQDGSFRLIQFLEQGQNGIPRNRVLTFMFSAPVAPAQDFAERLKIQNTQGNPGSNFSLATGTYETVGDRVTFNPRLPNKEDRSDAGLRENGEYTVFLKAGPDALRSDEGDPISVPQELLFNTSQFFEDPFPASPPRVTGLWARDATQAVGAPRTNISRLDPRPGELALLDNAALIDGARFIEPGAGGAPNYTTPWRLELEMTEPVDPSTVNNDTIQMFEIFSDATTSGDAAPPFAPDAHFGTPVSFKVPLSTKLEQQILPSGEYDVKIVVQPLVTLVDNTRYRLTFSGSILGIDFREQFIGVNGLTGDGETIVSGATPYPEPGGLGYVTEFIVRDRPAISAVRSLTYDPINDGIHAELGQTTNDPALFNTALYNPAASPSTAVGYLAAFGNGVDGSLAVASGTLTIDTGDTPNQALGKPFSVHDLNPNDQYDANTLPGGMRTYDSRRPFELNLDALTVSTGATLRFIGVNPVLLRVTGISQIAGTIDLAGGDGINGRNGNNAGGTAGPGGGAGGRSNRGPSCTVSNLTSVCSTSTHAAYMTAGCGAGWPWSLNGDGPGRGHAGGSSASYMYYYNQSGTTYSPQAGTGGGGGSRATAGQAGQDITSAGAAPGSAGNCINPSTYAAQNSSVVGVRGQPGAVHGDAELFDITWGGSGGGAGGSTSEYYTYGAVACGGSGGGGGGIFTLASAGAVILQGGRIDVSGGAGGAGGWGQYSTWGGYYGYYKISGGGGGGSGGGICLISGESINAANSVLDATGGTGGAAPINPNTSTPQPDACRGGNGGRGFIYLMDADGVIPGILPGTAGTYPTFATGYLKIAPLSDGANRFGEIRAITELYDVSAANPAYQEIDPANDILATVSANQEILLYASSAKADTDDPLNPNIVTEIAPVLVARVHYAFGATQVDTYGAMSLLNPTGPARDAFVRVNALFNYGNVVEAALGPFAFMDGFDIHVMFNG